MPLDLRASELTQQTERTYAVAGLITQLFFAENKNSESKYVELRIVKSGKQSAPYVSPMVGGKVMKREGTEVKVFQPPLLKPKFVTEADAILEQQARLYGDGLDAEDRAMAQLDKDEKELKLMVNRAKELQAVKVATEGKFLAKGDGVEAEFDYGMNANNMETLTGSAMWSDSASDPLQDLEDWQDEIFQLTGLAPNAVVMGKGASASFRKHQKVKDAFDTRHIYVGELKPVPMKDEDGKRLAGTAYVGYIEALDLHIYKYSDTIKDEDGNGVEVFPSNKILMGATDAGGHFAHGAISDAKELKGEIYIGEMFVKSYWTDDPAFEFLVAQSKPLAIPADVDSFKTVEVVA